MDSKQRYEDALQEAMCQAARYVASDQAFEIAHDVASELLRRFIAQSDAFPNQRAIDGFVRRSVMNRLRNFWRSAERRQATALQYHEERSDVAPEWAVPGSSLETRELRRVIDATIALMPPATRRAFLLIRAQHLSYKEAAAQLSVGTGTVHTHMSRATALLHRAVERYRSGEDTAPRAEETRNNLRIVS